MLKKFWKKITAHRPRPRKAKTTTRRPTIWARVRNFINRIWRAICAINLIGLINIALLSAIIVLFSMLILDIYGCDKKPAIIVANPISTSVHRNDDVTIRPVNVPSLPIARDAQTREYVTEPVKVVPTKKCVTTERQTARRDSKLYGDIIIDHRGATTILRAGDNVRGNLYLQSMRKYTLPCGVRIDGNLFLRDLNMLQFCGEFTVTGNIYVSPRSSFGPLPVNARIGGQIIL